MRLSVLANTAVSGTDPEIAGLTADSRAVKPGYLFAALSGARTDGANFLAEAVARGAVAALGDETVARRAQVPMIVDSNPRRRLAKIAARFYGRQPRTIAAVTGTNGKTSVVSFVRQIWTSLGRKAASFGTVGVVSPSGERPLGLTTPDPIEIHRVLAELEREGVECAAFEASSIGLAQYRVDGIELQAAAFTNLTRDHLDYHQTLDAYEGAKLRLFTELLPSSGVAVVNADAAAGAVFASAARARGQRLLLVGESEGVDLHIASREPRGDGQAVTLVWDGLRHEVVLPLAGAFQASNAAIAAGLVLGLGGDARGVFDALARLVGAAGRLQQIGVTKTGVSVYVDYAHTPDALANVLKALRAHTAGRLWVVFGCGGDRDAGKRPLMGQVAVMHADRVIVTDDNPRTESPAAIRAAILSGGSGAHEIGDRALAIEAAVVSAEAGDVVVIAGKGHETGQIFGHEVKPFSDLQEARRAIAAANGGSH